VSSILTGNLDDPAEIDIESEEEAKDPAEINIGDEEDEAEETAAGAAAQDPAEIELGDDDDDDEDCGALGALAGAYQQEEVQEATSAAASQAAPPSSAPESAVCYEDVDSMSVSKLKAIIAMAGLSHVDCVEKPQLKERAREAQAKLAGAPSSVCD